MSDTTSTPLNLLGYAPEQLTELVAQWGGKPFRARQLQRWMHQRGVDDFEQMTDLARSFRNNCQNTAPFTHRMLYMSSVLPMAPVSGCSM